MALFSLNLYIWGTTIIMNSQKKKGENLHNFIIAYVTNNSNKRNEWKNLILIKNDFVMIH